MGAVTTISHEMRTKMFLGPYNRRSTTFFLFLTNQDIGSRTNWDKRWLQSCSWWAGCLWQLSNDSVVSHSWKTCKYGSFMQKGFGGVSYIPHTITKCRASSAAPDKVMVLKNSKSHPHAVQLRSMQYRGCACPKVHDSSSSPDSRGCPHSKLAKMFRIRKSTSALEKVPFAGWYSGYRCPRVRSIFDRRYSKDTGILSIFDRWACRHWGLLSIFDRLHPGHKRNSIFSQSILRTRGLTTWGRILLYRMNLGNFHEEASKCFRHEDAAVKIINK